MKITLSPTRMDSALSLRRDDDVLTINDVPLDLAKYKDGDSVWVIGQPEQVKGVWQVMLVFPHGPDAPKTALFPKPVLAAKNGPILLPDTAETDVNSD
ncbi:hypothetical protein [Pseudorhodobacter ferrugineus]|uniref:hypothetical protein n=1 Tax=Pseudorhodobacter ferrugineus TaxID=77008 RepID=UPI0004276D81|nr:hypothetical protein [Pseudorhodobacter ferrugineus]